MNSISSACIASVFLAGTGAMASLGAFTPQGPVTVPNSFSPGTPARAAEVNDNFEALANGINATSSRIDQNAQAIDNLSAGAELVRVVAKSGAPFSTVAAALASITDAGADRPHRIDVAPGVYDEDVALIVPAFVRLAGAGMGTTVIRRAAADSNQSSSSAVITIEDNAQLSDLTVHNPGSGAPFSTGVLGVNLNGATAIDRVECIADGMDGGTHIAFLFQDSNVVVRDAMARASGGTVNNAGLTSINVSGQLNNLRVERCRLESQAGGIGIGLEAVRTTTEICDSYVFGSKHAIRAQVDGQTQVRGCALRSLQEVMSQAGLGQMRLANTTFSGFNPIGAPTSFVYVHCYKSNYSPVVNGAGSTIQ